MFNEVQIPPHNLLRVIYRAAYWVPHKNLALNGPYIGSKIDTGRYILI